MSFRKRKCCGKFLLRGLDPPSSLLAFTSRAVRFGPGEALMTRGEASDSAYVIIEGEVEIVGETPAGEFVVAVVGKNALIGEMGVITNSPRGTTVRAKVPVRALRIADHVFLRLLTDNPDCALHVMRDLSGRVNTGNARLAAALRDLEALQAQLRTAEQGTRSGAPLMPVSPAGASRVLVPEEARAATDVGLKRFTELWGAVSFAAVARWRPLFTKTCATATRRRSGGFTIWATSGTACAFAMKSLRCSTIAMPSSSRCGFTTPSTTSGPRPMNCAAPTCS